MEQSIYTKVQDAVRQLQQQHIGSTIVIGLTDAHQNEIVEKVMGYEKPAGRIRLNMLNIDGTEYEIRHTPYGNKSVIGCYYEVPSNTEFAMPPMTDIRAFIEIE